MRNWRGGGVLIGKIAFEVGEDIEEGEVSGVYIVCLLYMLSSGITCIYSVCLGINFFCWGI